MTEPSPIGSSPIRPVPLEPLPGLRVALLVATFQSAVGELAPLPVPASAKAEAIDPDLRKAVRDVLRQRGYKPTGRGKPSSEYLAAALADGRWPCIHAAVDIGNVVSLESGLPISVIDLDLVNGDLAIRTANAGASYVFNASGQEIDVGGLICLSDRDGPCANAVKDAQRTKTRPETTRVLGVVWGVDAGDPNRVERVVEDLGRRWQQCSADVVRVAVVEAKS
ncbi:MAG: phenylalanine--tRNA ligase beta subunit-related protein [Planctomycetota bacterium]